MLILFSDWALKNLKFTVKWHKLQHLNLFCIWNVYWKFGLSLFVLNLKWVFALLLRSVNPLKVNLRIFKQAVDVFFACGLTPCHVLFSIDSTLLSSNQKRRQNTMNVWTMSFDLYFFYIFSDKLFSNNSFNSQHVWTFNSFVWNHLSYKQVFIRRIYIFISLK